MGEYRSYSNANTMINNTGGDFFSFGLFNLETDVEGYLLLLIRVF